MTYNRDRAADFVLALMYLGVHQEGRAWKGYPWDVLDALYERGLISDPKRKAKSVVLTEEGLAHASAAFETLLAPPPTDERREIKAQSKRSPNQLSQLHTALVERLLGPICKPHPDPAVSSEVRHGYRLDEYSVILFESRPGFHSPDEWQDRDVAKFTFVKGEGVWRLFCQFRDLKWHGYEPLPESPDLEILVNEVRNDPTGIFWG